MPSSLPDRLERESLAIRPSLTLRVAKARVAWQTRNTPVDIMPTFKKSLELPVSCEEAFRWHERPGALERLVPPWEPVSVSQRADNIDVGATVVLSQRLGPIPMKWVAEHTEYDFGKLFRDVQRSGPFAKWDHQHRFEAAPNPTMTDEIDYRVPLGPVGQALGGRFVRDKIESMFEFRHHVTWHDLELHRRCSQQSLHFAVTGSSGVVGTALCALLTTGGHRVTRMVRRTAVENGEHFWDPTGRQAWEFPADVDVVVHLAGKDIGASRWMETVQREIRESRVDGTTELCRKMAACERPPATLIAASAIGYYGDGGESWLDESAPLGSGFLPDLVRDWEAATQSAAAAGIRVVNTRLGIVLSLRGGALAKLAPPTRWGVGGRLGSGKQYWSWISLHDAVSGILHLATNSEVSGPVNLVHPDVVTNREFTEILSGVLHRPALLPAPAWALRKIVGQMADELLLASARVSSSKLQASGFSFRHPDLEHALRLELGKL